MRRFTLANAGLIAACVAAAVGVSSPAEATTTAVVVNSCDSLTDNDTAGCLFVGNINGNPNQTNAASYLNAQDAYNAWATANNLPTITLDYLTGTDDANFGDFGSWTGSGGTSGTFDLSGFDLDFYAVKAGDKFIVYQYLGSDGTGNWSTAGLVNKQGQLQAVSHLAFFGTDAAPHVPEPSTWATMLIGFGATGFAMRRSRRKKALLTQIA